MSATDALRRMLDERGVGWVCYGYENHTWWNGWHAENRPSVNGLFVKLETVCTPNQAIAATLGDEREAELQKALNKAAGNWARADAELRKALDFMRIWISEDAHLGESAISREFEKAEGLRKLGAIEDAIEAWNMRAERTCHMEGDGCFPPNCSTCGWQADTYDCAWLEDGRYEYDGKFCKQCGAKVVEE